MRIVEKRKYESPRQLRRQSNILDTAREMLEELGYAGMTMRGLAKRAGVAQGTLYNLYASKDALVVAAVNDLLSQLRDTAMENNPDPGIDTILALTRVSGQQIQATPGYADAMVRTLANVYPGDPLVEHMYYRSGPFIKEQLDIAVSRGDLHEHTNTERLHHHMVAQAWGITWGWMMGMIALEDIADERVRADVTTLLPMATERTRERLQQQLASL